ncbi:MAG: AMP-binding protein [Rhizobiaceae bacterium]|nr:AMP-binding protein [Rhizobiaceae bacterium]
MDLANAPWKGIYPPGLSPDAKLDAYPVHDIVDRAAAEWSDKTAFRFRGRTTSFVALKGLVDRCAQAFMAAGLKKGDRVALFLPNTLYHPIAFFGAVKAGLVVVHLSPLDGEIVLKHKIADSGARVLITTNFEKMAERAASLLAGGLVESVIIGDDAALGASDGAGPKPEGTGIVDFKAFLDQAGDAPFPTVTPDDLALLQYTGGTTGLPKGAMLTHRNLSSSVSSYDLWSDAFDLMRPGEDRIVLFLPLFHIYSLSAVMLRTVKNGIETILHTRFDAETALREIEAGATGFPGVPTMWIAMAAVPDFEKRNFSSLRYCASGGAPLPVEVARKIKSGTGHSLLGGWGMTETSPAGTNIPATRPDMVGSIGVPLPGIWMDIVALDDPDRVLPPGETGELRIVGPNVATGYYNRPEETAAAFTPNGFLTGDIGFMDDEGFFTIVDRKKDMILSGGFNIYPQLIEQAIYEHPDVEEALVIGVADEYRGEAAKAFVKLRAGAEPLALDALRAFLKGRLGPHELPAALEIRDALPRTPVGKLSKLELKQEEAERRKTALAS